MAKYQSLNVLNQKSNLPLDETEVIAKINSMVNASGNRSQRRKIARSLNKTSTIAQYANARAEKKVEIRAENNFMYIFGIVGLTLYYDYLWDSSGDTEQIAEFYEKVTKRMDEFSQDGRSTQDILDEIERLTGVQLIPEQR